MADTFGTGDYRYELVEDWGQWPMAVSYTHLRAHET